MSYFQLRRIWSAVRKDFERARACLPIEPIEDEGSLARLTEWLDHNELGLALDELELLGEDNAAPSEFWRILAAAAGRMGFAEHEARYLARSA